MEKGGTAARLTGNVLYLHQDIETTLKPMNRISDQKTHGWMTSLYVAVMNDILINKWDLMTRRLVYQTEHSWIHFSMDAHCWRATGEGGGGEGAPPHAPAKKHTPLQSL